MTIDQPPRISVDDGIVSEIKPDGTKVDMTPDTALKTAEALIDAAAIAEGNRRIAAAAEQGYRPTE